MKTIDEMLKKIDKDVEKPLVSAQFGDIWKSHAIEHYNFHDIVNIAWRQGRRAILLERALREIFVQLESSEKEEFHVWIIPERKEILLEDRGGGIPVGATEHIVFDIWDGALKLCHFLEKTIGYTLEIDNEAGRWQSLN